MTLCSSFPKEPINKIISVAIILYACFHLRSSSTNLLKKHHFAKQTKKHFCDRKKKSFLTGCLFASSMFPDWREFFVSELPHPFFGWHVRWHVNRINKTGFILSSLHLSSFCLVVNWLNDPMAHLYFTCSFFAVFIGCACSNTFNNTTCSVLSFWQ